MCKHEYSTDVGDYLVIMIVGRIGIYIAEITRSKPMEMKVLETGVFSCLKQGDFIILENYSELYQKDYRGNTNVFLKAETAVGRKFVSWLKSLGVTDDRFHYILPSD